MAEILDHVDPPLTAALFYRMRPLFEISAISVVGCVAANVPECIRSVVVTACNKISEQLDELPLPKTVIDKLKQFSAPVYTSIHEWSSEIFGMYDMKRQMALNPFVAKHGGYRWKACGVIDSEPMAKLIISDEQLPLDKRFRTACGHCYTSDIVMLWNRLTEVERQSLSDPHIDSFDRYSMLVKYWCCVLNGNIDSLHSDEIELGFSLANDFGVSSSIKYFWNRLRPESKSGKLDQFASHAFGYKSFMYYRFKDFTNIVPFYVLQMTAEQQVQFLCHPNSLCLERLLQWPYQDLFIPAFKKANPTIVNYYELLSSAVNVFGDNYTTDDEVFSNNILYIWSKMTDSDRDKVFSEPLQYLVGLFAFKARLCLDVMLAELSPDKLKKIAFKGQCITGCRKIIEEHNWDGVAEVVRYLVPKNHECLGMFVKKLLAHLRERRMFNSANSHDNDVKYKAVEVKLSNIVDCYL